MDDRGVSTLARTISAGDLIGGLSASALLLPQSMAFGIALWLPYTNDAAGAALSGLITAACLCIASGLFRGTQGLVSAPTGPTLVLLSGAIAALAANGLSGRELVTATLLTVAMAGGIQMLVGALQIGHLVKFIPYPVVSGFMVGTGILMVLSQRSALSGGGVELTLSGGLWIPAATALATLLAMVLLPRLYRPVPATAYGLVVGTIVFHLLEWLFAGVSPDAWVVGNLPPVTAIHWGWDISSLSALPWMTIVASALALAVLASLDTLLTSVVADVATGERHVARRELMGQGFGHLLASLSGGMAGAGTTGSTLVAIGSGGRAWVGFFTGLGFLALILFMAPVAAILPVSMFAGIILHVAIFGMFDKDILLWMKTPSSRISAVIALVVILVTIFYDLMVAVGLGVFLAVIEFMREQAASAVVHRHWTAAERFSMRRRPLDQQAILKEHGESISVYELKGTLFFGTTDRLFDTVSNDLKQPHFVIFDMRRVGQVDLTAIRMVEHMSGMLRGSGGELILANVPKSMGLVKREGHRHERVIAYNQDTGFLTFGDVEGALEYAEDALLESLGESVGQERRIKLKESKLLSGFSPKEREDVEKYFATRKVKAGDDLFRAGDKGSELFVILEGEIEILLPYSKKKRVLLAKFGTGMTIGEVTFMEPGPRSADGRASKDCVLAVIDHSALKRLWKKHPDSGMKLLLEIGRDQSENLRRADEALRRLVS